MLKISKVFLLCLIFIQTLLSGVGIYFYDKSEIFIGLQQYATAAQYRGMAAFAHQMFDICVRVTKVSVIFFLLAVIYCFVKKYINKTVPVISNIWKENAQRYFYMLCLAVLLCVFFSIASKFSSCYINFCDAGLVPVPASMYP